MPCHNEPPRKHQVTDPYASPEPVPTPLKWTLPVLLAIVGALLLFEHRPHLGTILPFLLLVGGGLTGLLMHRRYGRTGHASHRQGDGTSR